MNGSEVTISPVLLQAISQTLTPAQSSQATASMADIRHDIKQEIIDNINAQRELSPPSVEDNTGQASGVNIGQQMFQGFSPPVSDQQPGFSMDDSTAISSSISQPVSAEDIKAMLKLKLGQNAGALGRAPDDKQAEVDQNFVISTAAGDINMVNMLSVLATQHIKSKTDGGGDAEPRGDNFQVPETITTQHQEPEENISETAKKQQQQQHVILCYDNNIRVPSPGNDVVVPESGSSSSTVNVVMNPDEHRYYMTEHSDSDIVMAKQARFDHSGGGIIIDSETGQPHIGIQFQMHSTSTPPAGPPEGVVIDPESLCPICGDAVSGYHYGIFTCESCKGFFKRTVQNKKTFSCHRKGDCEITKQSRKKCPACRFAKCIIMGMKLQAIRTDRMRGGRSSYDGCSPHGRPKYPLEMKSRTPKPKRPRTPSNKGQQSTPTLPVHKGLENVNVTLPSGENISGSQLVAMLNRSGKSLSEETKPFVPHLLTEIMNVESYLCEDENASDFPPERLSENDPSFMLSLLQLAELRLYKLVRWARNLPQFSSISTDDQILLLQNCWADLLLFNCCMRSIQSTTEIFLPMGKSIDMEKAGRLGHGADDIVSRLLSITEQLRRLQVDQYEFVALKVLMLISPDVKGLKEPQKAREHQDAVCEALGLYTDSHYPQLTNKFGELLLRLPEISRVSMMGKDILNSVMPPEFQSCGLLFELLKGDGLKDDV